MFYLDEMKHQSGRHPWPALQTLVRTSEVFIALGHMTEFDKSFWSILLSNGRFLHIEDKRLLCDRALKKKELSHGTPESGLHKNYSYQSV